MVFSCLKASMSKESRRSGSTRPTRLCSTGIRRSVPSAPSTSAGSTRRGISSLEYSFNAGNFSRNVAMIWSSVGFDRGMPISKDMVVSEVSTDDARPKPRRNDRVEEKARTHFNRIIFEFGLHPAGQETAGERVNSSGGQGGRRGGVKDNGAAKLAGLKDAGMRFVKGFRRRYAMGNFPDVKIRLAIEPAKNHREPAFVGKTNMQNALAGVQFVLQHASVISQLVRGESRIQHFTLQQYIDCVRGDGCRQNSSCNVAGFFFVARKPCCKPRVRGCT